LETSLTPALMGLVTKEESRKGGVEIQEKQTPMMGEGGLQSVKGRRGKKHGLEGAGLFPKGVLKTKLWELARRGVCGKVYLGPSFLAREYKVANRGGRCSCHMMQSTSGVIYGGTLIPRVGVVILTVKRGGNVEKERINSLSRGGKKKRETRKNHIREDLEKGTITSTARSGSWWISMKEAPSSGRFPIKGHKDRSGELGKGGGHECFKPSSSPQSAELRGVRRVSGKFNTALWYLRYPQSKKNVLWTWGSNLPRRRVASSCSGSGP